MTCSQIVLNGLSLISDNFFAILATADDFEKDVTTNDLLDDGEAWGRSKNKSRTLTLNIAILRLTQVNVQTLNRALASSGLKTLTVTTPGGIRSAQVEVVSRVTGDSAALVAVSLIMPDPYWYAAEDTTISLGSTSNSALILPATLPWTLGSLTGGEGVLINGGNADAYPIITIVGTCSHIGVANLTTGESVSVSAALTDSDALVIDCRPDTCGVYLNGAARIDLKTSVGWMRCVSGSNTISFSRTSLQDKKHCTVSLKSRWM